MQTMITYSVNRFLHSIIRENKLVYIMEFLVKDRKKDILIEDFIRQLERFLLKAHDDLFDHTRLKYMIFLEEVKEGSKKMKDLKTKTEIEKNEIFFNLYELPKKRNNVLLVILLYYYVHNKHFLRGKQLFNIIYIYLMIIAYRNRLSGRMRSNILKVNRKRFVSMREKLGGEFSIFRRGFDPKRFGPLMFVIITALLALLGAVGLLMPSGAALKTSVLEGGGKNTFSQIAFDSMMIGRVSDPVIKSIQGIGYQNILLLIVFAMLVQSLKTSLSTVFFNSLLSKTFSFIWMIIRYANRAVFYFYNFMVYKIETRLIFAFTDWFISRGIAPGPVIMLLFGVAYALVYLAAISLYLIAAVWLSGVHVGFLPLIGIGILFSALAIYINFHHDTENMKAFLIEINTIIKSLYGKEGNQKKA